MNQTATEFRRLWKAGRAPESKRLAERINRATEMGMIGAMRVAHSLYVAYPDVDWEHGYDWEGDILQGFIYDSRTLGMGERYARFWEILEAKTGYKKPLTAGEERAELEASMMGEYESVSAQFDPWMRDVIENRRIPFQDLPRELQDAVYGLSDDAKRAMHDVVGDLLYEYSDEPEIKVALERAKSAMGRQPPDPIVREVTAPRPQKKRERKPPEPTVPTAAMPAGIEQMLNAILGEVQGLKGRISSLELEVAAVKPVAPPMKPAPPIAPPVAPAVTPEHRLEMIVRDLNARIGELARETQRARATKEELAKIFHDATTGVLSRMAETEAGLPERKHELEGVRDPVSGEVHFVDWDLINRLRTNYTKIHRGKRVEVMPAVLELPERQYRLTEENQIEEYGLPWQIVLADEFYKGEMFLTKQPGIAPVGRRIGITADELKERGLDDEDVKWLWDIIMSNPKRYPPTQFKRGELVLEK